MQPRSEPGAERSQGALQRREREGHTESCHHGDPRPPAPGLPGGRSLETPGLLESVSVWIPRPAVLKRSSVSFSPIHCHPGKRRQVPLGKAGGQVKSINSGGAQQGPSSRGTSLPFIQGALGLEIGPGLRTD